MGYHDILLLAKQMRKNPTLAESTFWEKVRNRKLEGLKFYRQYVYQYDFMNNKYKLSQDLIWQSIIEKQGIKVLRFNNKEVIENWTSVSSKILALI